MYGGWALPAIKHNSQGCETLHLMKLLPAKAHASPNQSVSQVSLCPTVLTL